MPYRFRHGRAQSVFHLTPVLVSVGESVLVSNRSRASSLPCLYRSCRVPAFLRQPQYIGGAAPAFVDQRTVVVHTEIDQLFHREVGLVHLAGHRGGSLGLNLVKVNIQ